MVSAFNASFELLIPPIALSARAAWKKLSLRFRNLIGSDVYIGEIVAIFSSTNNKGDAVRVIKKNKML